MKRRQGWRERNTCRGCERGKKTEERLIEREEGGGEREGLKKAGH